MNQIPALIIIALVAVFVPLALARLIVRADWKIIRNSCMLWYGFLLLAFEGFKSAEHFGWALTFAIFFSIPAVPLLSLILKLWKRLGKTPAPTVTSQARHWWSRFTLGRMSPAQWTVASLILVGGILYVSWRDQQDINIRTAVLRTFFALPADIQFTDVNRISKSAPTNPRIEAVAEFTEPQWAAYLQQANQTAQWSLKNVALEDKPLDLASAGNLSWRPSPLPDMVRDHSIRWSKLFSERVSAIRNVRWLCIALRIKRWDERGEGDRSKLPEYAALDCSSISLRQSVSKLVIGVLDLDTKTIHIVMN
jgi:hypothetical protein